LLENGSIEIETAPNVKKVLWRYKFVSDWHWQILNRYAFPTVEEKFKYATEMIKNLKIVFETNERFAAKSLAKLCKTVKDDDSARDYQQIADYAMSFEKTRELALALLQVDTTGWNQFRCQQLGIFLYKAGKKIYGANPYEDLTVFEKAEELAHKAFDTETQAHSLYCVAIIHANFGEFHIAENKANLCLKLYEGFNNKLYESKVCHLLGYVYDVEGRYAEAEPLYKKAVAIDESELGETHLTTASSYHNLATLYVSQKRYNESEVLFKKVLAIRVKVLGESHPETARSYLNFAGLFYSQHEYDKTEPLLKKALAIWVQVLGENHPDTATVFNNLGKFYHTQDRYKEAEPFYKKALVIREEILGGNHPDTIITRQNLESLLEKLADSK
jgi:tetratricopeptide (TPR) repeat protein